MAIQKTDAVLLRKKDLRETSLILTFFTRDFGKVRGLLKGARGARSRSGANPLFFSLEQIVFYEKKKSDLFVISQSETQRAFLNILKEWKRASVAYYILELTDVFTEPGEKLEPIFEDLVNSLISLDEKKEPGTIARLFEVRFLMALGLWPGSETFTLTKGTVSSLSCFERGRWQISSKIKLNREAEAEIKKVTGEIISGNLDKPLKTVKMLKE